MLDDDARNDGALPPGRERWAVVVVDVVESVRLMELDESKHIDRWRRFVDETVRDVLPPLHGRLVKSLGDGMLLEFRAVQDAVAAALELQRRVVPYSAGVPDDFAMHLRIGANVTELVRDEHDIYGAGVNLAARIASLGGPGEIVVTADFRDELFAGLDADIEDLGECVLKHIAHPVRAYRIGPAGPRPMVPGDAQNLVLQATVAVIPFAAGDEQGRIVGEVLADGIIAQLSLTAELRVISRLSSSAFAGRRQDLASIRAFLQADYIVSGSVLVHGERLIVTSELCEARGSSVIWAEQLTGSIGELLSSHSGLTEKIAGSVHDAVLRREVLQARQMALPTLRSYSLLLGAVNLMHRQTRGDFERARALLEHLSERHPRHATPRAWLAKWYAVGAAQGWLADRSLSAEIARQEVRRALEAEPANALAWSIKGLLAGYGDADFDSAEADFREALRNNPSESLAWLFLATLQGWRGEGADAVASAGQALRLSPLDPLKYYFDSLAGAAMLGARQYDQAIALSTRSLRSNRSHLSTLRVLAMAQALSGDVDAAKVTVRELLTKDPKFTVATFLRVSPWRVSPEVSLLASALREAGVPVD
jgi:class 3 adenylate cyclase/TolB-like protein/Tfp pilus assembly protein PilF